MPRRCHDANLLLTHAHSHNRVPGVLPREQSADASPSFAYEVELLLLLLAAAPADDDGRCMHTSYTTAT